MEGQRKIIHIDMDAFYASVEQRDNPQYRGKPLVVGGRPEKRGAVAAASYEARQFGIHSAMPSRTALQRCPHLIFAVPRFDVYRGISEQIRTIFKSYTDLVEPLALDEAYLDVTHNKKSIGSATAIARDIKQDILNETKLTASAGVSLNKFLAKIASGMNKPDGLTVILPTEAEAFVEVLAIESFYGIGPATAHKMHELGIHTGADLKLRSEIDLEKQFGKTGHFYYQIARGIDERPVNPNRIRKSIGAETSFDPDLEDISRIERELYAIVQVVQQRLERNAAKGRTITLKVKFADYQQITRSRTVLNFIDGESQVSLLAQELLKDVEIEQRKVRLLGITISNLDAETEAPSYKQLVLDLQPFPGSISRSSDIDWV
ncbi:MAG: DNA polymerase IV [Acaryochloridaceae cyanobacterium RU_4_10]|nr:DNA polymerase IV [Acaryochloridaceae cyanobacterium RU_4_10]